LAAKIFGCAQQKIISELKLEILKVLKSYLGFEAERMAAIEVLEGRLRGSIVEVGVVNSVLGQRVQEIGELKADGQRQTAELGTQRKLLGDSVEKVRVLCDEKLRLQKDVERLGTENSNATAKLTQDHKKEVERLGTENSNVNAKLTLGCLATKAEDDKLIAKYKAANAQLIKNQEIVKGQRETEVKGFEAKILAESLLIKSQVSSAQKESQNQIGTIEKNFTVSISEIYNQVCAKNQEILTAAAKKPFLQGLLGILPTQASSDLGQSQTMSVDSQRLAQSNPNLPLAPSGNENFQEVTGKLKTELSNLFGTVKVESDENTKVITK
jgi:hypothetical protein